MRRCAALARLALAFMLAAGGETRAEPNAAAVPAPGPPGTVAEVDLAFGAYQRGLYLTAFKEASQRVADNPQDAAAMTLLGELYAIGLGVTQDWARAAEWYRRAAARGDPQAAFALGMILIEGPGSIARDPARARLLLEAASEAVPAAAANLALLLLRDGSAQSDRRAAELLRRAAAADDVDAQYGLALLYREGRGLPESLGDAALWMGKAAQGRNLAAQVEYAVMLFNGEGLRKDETAAARMFLRAAERGNPIAQNRIARIYASGRGLPRDLVEARKWHILATRQGVADAWLDEATQGLTPAERERAEQGARRWIGQ